MKKRFIVVYLLLLTLLAMSAQVYAQAAPFSAWLYEQQTGTLTLVDSSGATLDTFVLPTEATYTYSRNIAVSDNGNLFAYVVSDNAAPNNGFLYIYDRAADSVRYAFDMGPTPTHSLDFVASNLNFSADNATFAFGYANSDMSRWWALTIDITTFEVIGGIRSTDPLAANNGLPDQFLLPVVQSNRDGLVVFNPVALATEGFSEYDAFTWNLEETSLTPNAIYRSLSTDTFIPTGDVVLPFEDVRLPLTTGDYIYFQYNTLQVYDRALSARYPFFTDSEMFYSDVRFVQGGERVLASGYPSDSNDIVWSLIERSGALVGYFPVLDISSFDGVVDGFIYTSNELDAQNRPQLLFVNTRDGLDTVETGTAIWTGATPASVVKIVWNSQFATVSGAAFAPWAQVAAPTDPLVDAPAPAGSTSAPAAQLTVGGQAAINTSGGDQLNVRSGAGTTFAIVTPLNAGTVVTLLEGPVVADGFTWWRIRTDTGVEGWVIESIDDGGTRLQTLIPR